jgi:hypothetical protein
MQNYCSLAPIQTDMDKFLTFFQEHFRIYQKILKRISKTSKSEHAVLSLN